MLRQIVVDTETTGISHEKGHRIIEIGAVEIINRQITDNYFHYYLNPERLVDEEAFKVHGLSDDFLRDKPLFKAIVQEFLQFIDNAELIIHNAVFDLGFLNAELKLLAYGSQVEQHCQKIIDTLLLARQKCPGQRNSLDALCKRYNIDNSSRSHHGALLDARILASVYLAMTGGQGNLFTEVNDNASNFQMISEQKLVSHTPVVLANQEEIDKHQTFVNFIVKKSGINHWS